MRNSPLYILALVAFIGGSMGYVFATSEVRTVTVVGKHIEEGRSRRGRVDVHIVETDAGNLRILKFPVIGYAYGADDVYAGIRSGSSLKVRIGQWPPAVISSHAKPHIMAVY